MRDGASLPGGTGSITGLVDAPTTLAGSYQYCPTGNAPNGGALLTPTELGNLLRQYGSPFDDGNLDFFQADGIIRNSDIGRAIQPLGLSSLYALVGSGNAGAGGMALTPGQASVGLIGGVPLAAVVGGGGGRANGTVASTLGQVGCVAGHIGEGILHVGEGATAVAAGAAAPAVVGGFAPEAAPVTVPGTIIGISVPAIVGGAVLIGSGVRSFATTSEC